MSGIQKGILIWSVFCPELISHRFFTLDFLHRFSHYFFLNSICYFLEISFWSSSLYKINHFIITFLAVAFQKIYLHCFSCFAGKKEFFKNQNWIRHYVLYIYIYTLKKLTVWLKLDSGEAVSLCWNFRESFAKKLNIIRLYFSPQLWSSIAVLGILWNYKHCHRNVSCEQRYF